jgi:hypothetical protein
LTGEIDRVVGNKEVYAQMLEDTKSFNKPGAAEKIARALVDIALEHETD